MNMIRCVLVMVLMTEGALGKGLLYPHMANNGDILGPTTDDDYVRHDLSVPVVYFETSCDTAFVNENGIVSLVRDFWWFVATPLSPEGGGHVPFIALFWGDHFIKAGNKGAHIWSRETDDADLLTRAKNDVQNAFVDCHEGFEPTRLVIATYQRVKAFCMSEDESDPEFPTTSDGENSYQAILITDGVETYVMFNFHTIEWTEGCPGEPAIAGFNAGDGRFFELPFSGTTDVGKLAEESNVGKPGRWIYKVDGFEVLGPDCEVAQKFPCSCSGGSLNPSAVVPVVTYDDLDLGITGEQRTFLTTWNDDITDPCKFSVLAVTKKNSLVIDWFGINVGVHPNPKKHQRNFRIKDNQVIERGQFGSKQPLSLPHHYLSPDEYTDAFIYKPEANHIRVLGYKCPYAIDIITEGHSIVDFTISVGDMYRDGLLDGLCGNCNGDSADDWTTCFDGVDVSGEPDPVDAVSDSCAWKK